MTHPLTDEMCEELSCFPFEDCDEDGLIHDMRAAYDKGAADTLERVIEWLNAEIAINYDINIDRLPEKLEKAMRPQQQQEES